jgi:hypothetical protein
MPANSHRYLDVTNLGFKTLNSPTSTEPVYQGGENAMVSQRGYLESRPGFGAISIPEPVAGWAGTIRRIFWWSRWDGKYFGMVCSNDATQSYVYKYESGADANAVLIWNSTSATPFDFVVSNDTCFFGNGVDMKKYEGNGTTVYPWGTNAPTVTPTTSLSSGTLSAIAGGYYYFYTYVRSSNNHESSPSSAGTCTGLFASKKVTVQGQYSADAQIDKVYIYRSTDGGGANPSEAFLVTSIANVVGTGTWSYDDQTIDTSLGTRNAPAISRNDPPTPSRGFVTHSGRIFGFNNNKLYYSGFEEISFDGGVPEECWPGGADGNFRPYPNRINALAAVGDGVLIYQAGTIFKVEGDSLDTFRWYQFASHQGAQSPSATASFGTMATWFDTSSSVWFVGGNELSLPIRPTLAGVNSTSAYLAIHMQNQYRWVVALDSVNATLYVMDTDLGAWFVPWTFSKSVTALFSGESSAGTVDLCIALDNQVVKLTPGTYQDLYRTGVQSYPAWAKTNLFNVVRDGSPDDLGLLDHVAIERGTVAETDFKLLIDDDTDNDAAYKSLYSTLITPEVGALRKQGAMLLEDQFRVNLSNDNRNARRVSIRFDWSGGAWKLFSIDLAYQPQERR